LEKLLINVEFDIFVLISDEIEKFAQDIDVLIILKNHARIYPNPHT